MKRKKKRQHYFTGMMHTHKVFALILLISIAFTGNALAFNLTVNGVDSAGNETEITDYRWLIEEDKTYHVQYMPDGITPDPTATDPTWDQLKTLSVSFHRSYMPVVATNETMNISEFVPEEGKYYYISVLSNEGHSLGGAQIAQGQVNVTVYLNQAPIPTAQISIFVHKDIAPINNVWDQGEAGLEGFVIVLEDAGGRYGISAGMQMLDVFGNPLCTQYDDQGNTVGMSGVCTTGPDGRITIKNIAPGKYGIIVVPPNAQENPANSGNYVSTNWVQTSTIEGKKIIDTWVKANEPSWFSEFGPPGPHVSVGFVPAGKNNPYIDASVLTGGGTISGQVVNLHLSRPPGTTFHAGAPFAHTTPWVGLNMGPTGDGKGIFAKRVNSDGSFSIPNVPAGSYQLVIWDDYLDLIFGSKGVVIGENQNVALGPVPVFQWFTRTEHWVFNDDNENGFRDNGEIGIPEQAVNLRWRDGSVYQSFPTDGTGFVPFDEIFPFFSWLVAEVDFTRGKATGLTVTVDDGGAISDVPEEGAGTNWQSQLTPQTQGNPIDTSSAVTTPGYRTELGPVLTQGFQGFLGQTSVFEWGKKSYVAGENGGISGMVFYAVTRAEDDPEMAAAEPWEPGIPSVTVELYEYINGAMGNLVATTLTDSWDDSLPTECQYGANAGSAGDAPYNFRGTNTDCFDGMRNWNQVRPGVFDGGYAFDGLTPGRYVVKIIPPPGYKVIRSQDRNVDFGDVFGPPVPDLLPPKCIGTPYNVPDQLSLFPGESAPLATSTTGKQLNLCDSKIVELSDRANAAADFFLFTDVPPSAHIMGFVLDDLANEFNPNSPQFGEKYAPPFLPISIRDWTGREIGRTVSDENGSYNTLVPSTFTENLGKPSGISPNMLTTCINAKTLPNGQSDPLHNPQYSQFCYNFQYMPGVTTYLDTPVLPVAAFAGPDQSLLDCEFSDGTPRIHSVTNSLNEGPYIRANSQGQVTDGALTIMSMGTSYPVPNPAYQGSGGATPRIITRDYGFGATSGMVSLVAQDGVNYPIQVIQNGWNNDMIQAIVPNMPKGAYQLMITRNDNNKSTITGVTIQVGLRKYANVITVDSPAPANQFPGAIQAAIDAAGQNDLILVAPGTYPEQVIMWKPVQLQGWGEGSVTIDAVKTPTEKLVAWRAHIQNLVTQNNITLTPLQEAGFGGIEPDALFSEEGAGVLVLAKRSGTNRFAVSRNQGARIDGFTISGADTGGGIVANGYVKYLEISNNRIINNSGYYSGGIRLGHPAIQVAENNTINYTIANNQNIRIHNNQISQNGGLTGAGGGVSICPGSDNYELTQNFICGNFTTASGAGIAHYGLSDNGSITDNTILFNENFNQGINVNGGGILISGQPPIAGTPTVPSPGSGSVSIERNLIQGNAAGAGDGGGIRLNWINGQDVSISQEGVLSYAHSIDIINNIIVNNVAGLAGGGISLQDSLGVRILNNTIVYNSNTSTASTAFSPESPAQSNPQPGAGIVSRNHSPGLAELTAQAGLSGFSDPEIVNNIIWRNRKFFFLSDASNPASVVNGLCPDINGNVGLNCPGGNSKVHDDLAIIPAGIFTNTQANLTSINTGKMQFRSNYENGNRDSTVIIPEQTTAIQAPAAFDEGGNFIRLRYGPLTQTILKNGQWIFRGDYHIKKGSPALDTGVNTGISNDYDSDFRPNGVAFDIGADER